MDVVRFLNVDIFGMPKQTEELFVARVIMIDSMMIILQSL